MPAQNTGSIRQDIYDSISPFPSTVSGALTFIVNNAVFFAEQLTGDTIGTTSIGERYQPAIHNLAIANVLRLMGTQDMGVKSVSVGDLSTDNSNLMEMARQFEERGIFQIKALTKGIKYYKARG